MANQILKLNITAISNPKYLLQLQFVCFEVGVYLHDFDGTNDSHTIWGKDHNIYLPNEIDTINYDYNFDDKLIIPGIWNLSILDDDSFLDELIFENHSSLLFDNRFPINVDLTKPINALLFRVEDNEIFKFPLDSWHVPFFSGIMDTKSPSFDEVTKLLSISVYPNIAILKETDITNVRLTSPSADEIPNISTSLKTTLFNILRIAFPLLKRENVIIRHEWIFYASTNPLTDFNWYECTIDDIMFNPLEVSNRLGITSCHEILKAFCFSFFATLTITHNKAIFASVNKSFITDTTINATRLISEFKKEISFEAIKWIDIRYIQSSTITGSKVIGTKSILTKGIEKDVIFNAQRTISTSPMTVLNNQNTMLYIAFAKKNSAAINKNYLYALAATLWFDYMNIFISGRIYKFQIQTLNFNFSNSFGYKNRLYSPVGIHYNIVDDSTEVEAVRN